MYLLLYKSQSLTVEHRSAGPLGGIDRTGVFLQIAEHVFVVRITIGLHLGERVFEVRVLSSLEGDARLLFFPKLILPITALLLGVRPAQSFSNRLRSAVPPRSVLISHIFVLLSDVCPCNADVSVSVAAKIHGDFK
jgi:hypothetical protein